MARLQIRLFGPFEAVLDGERIKRFESGTAQALLAYLASEPGRSWSRSAVAEMLWPERPEGAALSNLRHVLSILRRVLGDRGSESPFLVGDRRTIALEGDVWVDLAEFDRLASLRADAEDGVEVWEQIAELWRGPLLDGVRVGAGAEWDEWVVVTEERSRRLFVDALRHLADHYERRGDWDSALDYTLRLVEADPWDERSCRAAMRLFAYSGAAGRALACFDDLTRRLAADLDSGPSPATIALAEQIRAGDIADTAPHTEISYPAFLNTEPRHPPRQPFVGREHELRFLDEHLDQTLGGAGHVVLIAGEAGSGKTMLADEAARRAVRVPELLAVRGRCNAYGGLGDPYLPFREVLGQLTGDVEAVLGSGSMVHEQGFRLWEAIPLTARLVLDRGPSLIGVMVNGSLLMERVAEAIPGADLLDDLEARVAAASTRPPGPERMQPALFDEYTAFLDGVAAVHPVLIVIDDLQWADRGSIALFWHLSRRLEGRRVLMFGLFRPEEIADERGEPHPLQSVLDELRAAPSPQSIELSGSRGFVDAFVDSEPNDLAADFRERLFASTEGHPLFTVEMVRGMQDRAEIRRNQAGLWTAAGSLDWQRLPTRVEAAIAQRVNRLPDGLRRDLTVAAVQGEEFTAETVAAVRDDASALGRLTEESSSAGGVVGPAGADRLGGRLFTRHRFRHILFQRYFYDQLDDGERVRLHELTGRAMERLYGGLPEAPVVDLAHHFHEAGLVEPAIDYAFRAGVRAIGMSANEEAIRLLQRALVLLMSLPESAERDLRELEILAALAAPTMAVRGYTAPEAELGGRRARELCSRIEPSPVKALALAALAHYQTIRALHREAEEASREVKEVADTLGNSALQVLGTYMLGYEQMWVGELTDGRRNLDEAIRRYDPEQHAWLMGSLGQAVGPEALAWGAVATLHCGFPDRATRLAEEGIALARHIAHPFSLCHALEIGGVLLKVMAGDFEGAVAGARDARAVAEDEHFPFWAAAVDIHEGIALGHLGDVDAAIAAVERGLGAWWAMGVEAFRGWFLASLADLERLRGRPEHGLEIVEAELERPGTAIERLSEVHLLVERGPLLAAMGRLDEATVALDGAIAAANRIGARLLALQATTALARMLADSDRRGESLHALEPVYASWDEGLDTPHLVAARAVLDRL